MAGLGTIDIEKCISYSHDLVDVLKNKKDANNLMQSLEETEMLQSIGKADSSEVKSLLEDYKKKIDACQQMIEDAKDVIISDEVLNRLENQLEEEHQREHSLTKEIRCVEDQLGELECQKVQVEDRRKILKEIELDGLRVHICCFSHVRMHTSHTSNYSCHDESYFCVFDPGGTFRYMLRSHTSSQRWTTPQKFVAKSWQR